MQSPRGSTSLSAATFQKLARVQSVTPPLTHIKEASKNSPLPFPISSFKAAEPQALSARSLVTR